MSLLAEGGHNGLERNRKELMLKYIQSIENHIKKLNKLGFIMHGDEDLLSMIIRDEENPNFIKQLKNNESALISYNKNKKIK